MPLSDMMTTLLRYKSWLGFKVAINEAARELALRADREEVD